MSLLAALEQAMAVASMPDEEIDNLVERTDELVKHLSGILAMVDDVSTRVDVGDTLEQDLNEMRGALTYAISKLGARTTRARHLRLVP